MAPGEPFCTANGSHFALWLSVCQGQTRRVGKFSQASLLAWMNITAWLQGRKPRESNKLFDLFLPKSESVLSVVEQKFQEDRCLSLFIALRWMQEPGGVMVWLAENIQACLRIFRRTQHQWLTRDILHQQQGVYSVFVLHPVSTSKSILSVPSVVEQKLPEDGKVYPCLSPCDGCKTVKG